MAITLRNTKGSALTYTELDDNFLFLSTSYVKSSLTSSMTVLSSSFARSASWAPASAVTLAVSSSGSTIYSTNPGTYGFSTNNSIILGLNAGLNATDAEQSNFLGYGAGYGASQAYNSNFLGNNAGSSATNASDSNFFGQNAGVNATGAGFSNFFGRESGYYATNAYFSNFIGFYSGRGAINAENSNFLGNSAGLNAYYASGSNFTGYYAGYLADRAEYSNFIGYAAGSNASSASFSNLIGYYAGHSAVNASHSILIGNQAGRKLSGTGIGPNNIIIGTNITLEDGRKDSINLGNIIYATGSYSDPTGGNQSYTPMPNARVGINKSIPEYTLDVSGSGRFTGGIVSNPTGSRREYASFGSLTTDTSELSGSSFGYFLPPGYLTYYIFTNHSYNGVSTVYLYNLTNSGTRLNPAYNSTITIINKGGGNVASITRNLSDTGVTINRATTSEAFTSCSLATNSYITLFVEDGSSPNWVILASGSLY